jgi:hypothetical protein
METCPLCEGIGDYLDRRRVRCDSIDPPYSTCPLCKGNGEVDEETIESYDPRRSFYSYEQDNKDEAALQRWEEARDC